MTSFKLPLRVIPKTRPRVTRSSTYMPPKYLAQRRYIQSKIRGLESFGKVSIKLDILFVYKCSETIARNKYEMPVGDIDNLVGAVLDACEGILFENDRQVVQVKARKMWGDIDTVVCIFEDML